MATEVGWEMEKETIIFFDKLGFGWVLDSLMLKGMNLSHFKADPTAGKCLMQIIENLLENPGL